MGRKQGTSGPDTIIGGSGRDEINGVGGDDTIRGGGGDDILTGDEGDDWVYGDAGNDIILGGAGIDHLYGGTGNDELGSGSGADVLEGGAGADVFRYRGTAESSTQTLLSGDAGSGVAGVDTITDFESGIDKIMLSDLDANVLTPLGRRGAGNESFTFSTKTSAFVAGDLTLTYSHDADGNVTETLLQAHVDDDGVADLTISILGYVNPGDILY